MPPPRLASKSLFGLVWPWPWRMTSWPPTLTILCPCPVNRVCQLASNRFIYFKIPCLQGFVTDGRTDGRTDWQVDNTMTAPAICLGGGEVLTTLSSECRWSAQCNVCRAMHCFYASATTDCQAEALCFGAALGSSSFSSFVDFIVQFYVNSVYCRYEHSCPVVRQLSLTLSSTDCCNVRSTSSRSTTNQPEMFSLTTMIDLGQISWLTEINHSKTIWPMWSFHFFHSNKTERCC